MDSKSRGVGSSKRRSNSASRDTTANPTEGYPPRSFSRPEPKASGGSQQPTTAPRHPSRASSSRVDAPESGIIQPQRILVPEPLVESASGQGSDDSDATTRPPPVPPNPHTGSRSNGQIGTGPQPGPVVQDNLFEWVGSFSPPDGAVPTTVYPIMPTARMQTMPTETVQGNGSQIQGNYTTIPEVYHTPPSEPQEPAPAEASSGPYRYRPRPFRHGSHGPKHQTNLAMHLLDQLMRQIYIHILLRIPSIYFTRVFKLFERPERIGTFMRGDSVIPSYGAVYIPENRWGDFVHTVMKEWKTLNVVAVLALSAILTLLQISDVANGVITRTTALVALICSIWALIFGCLYILRFGTMDTDEKAQRWAKATRATKTKIFWNVWVMLAMPAVWLSWSIIAFCASILAYVWTTGSNTDNPTLPSRHADLGPRILISAIFGVGLVYLGLILQTFQAYGDEDKVWSTTSPYIPIGGRSGGWSQPVVVQVPGLNAIPPPVPAPNATLGRVRALWTFAATEWGELGFEKGDIVDVVDRNYKDWWRGRLNGKTGVFPANYVESLPDSDMVAGYDVKVADEKPGTTAVPPQGQTPKDARPEPTPQKVIAHVRALFSFDAEDSRDLAFKKGDIIEVTERTDKNWWTGQLGGRSGIFPVSYVTGLTYSTVVPTTRASLDATTIPGVKRVRALRGSDPPYEPNLAFEKGDVITVLERKYDDGGWWVGQLGDRTGIFPLSHVVRLRILCFTW
ncbi:hypothetical protein BD410DRAFT_386979 [Rickenella mellea]|uniref:SH3 domain-containing protein n=1 Tax=Rickenella mellea TaxID=50990 RepID=A0A4Y7PZA8_9AGAM|nr:hypothetical protein BD410DRAFT_386979 [Rickenella mellea]